MRVNVFLIAEITDKREPLQLQQMQQQLQQLQTTTNAGKLLLFMPVRVDKFCQRQEYLVCGICDVTGLHCVRSTLDKNCQVTR